MQIILGTIVGIVIEYWLNCRIRKWRARFQIKKLQKLAGLYEIYSLIIFINSSISDCLAVKGTPL